MLYIALALLENNLIIMMEKEDNKIEEKQMFLSKETSDLNSKRDKSVSNDKYLKEVYSKKEEQTGIPEKGEY